MTLNRIPTRTRAWAAAVAVVLVAGTGTSAVAAPPHAAPPSPTATGTDRLHHDATSSLATRSDHGRLRFAGVHGHGRIDNPEVGSGTGVRAAARAHLKRYGAAFGADRAGTTLALSGTTRAVSGQDVVRFEQRVDDVPVLGADVVVSLTGGRDLASMSAGLSSAEQVADPQVPEADAADAARVVAARAIGGKKASTTGLEVAGQGRALFDPAVFGEPAPDGARSGWRFEVTGPAGVRRLVLVDDQTGAPLLNIDENQQLDRVVCDNGNVRQPGDVLCRSSSKFKRTETGPASAIPDVNDAFTNAKPVSDLYATIGGLDLTGLLGLPDTAGRKHLAATVRWCYTTDGCPYENAFWDGQQMFYGEGFAGADDVVGHEMTHGVIDHFSQLFYWGQSGAINESLADTMGEIIDHVHPSPGDSATDWRIGEDLPIGALRSMSDPTLFDQPDSMVSPLYTSDVDTGYADNGGVHTDSGVGNKTAYLISQGGTFNGQTITGIDAVDPTLTKTATLYLDVIEKLTSGSDYADLATRLDQSCQDFLTAGTAGFTLADCTSVHAATLATELRVTPPAAEQPVDAAQTCPAGTETAVLFDSEAGNPASSFTAGSGWTRGGSPIWGINATSGTQAWSNTTAFDFSDTTPSASSLTLAQPVTLPAGQESYLWFQGWYVLDYDADGFYDGGTVEVDRTDDALPFADASGQPWVNGPTATLSDSYGNPVGGRFSFSGDSHGWVASRVDLSDLGGHPIRPRFTLGLDSSYTYVGWFLDDIRIYSCVTSVVNRTPPSISGSAGFGGTLTASTGTWLPRVDSYAFQWLRDGSPVPGATRTTYGLGVADVGRRISLRVTAHASSLGNGVADSAPTAPIAPGTIAAARPRVRGKAKVKKVLHAAAGAWSPAGVTLSYQWLRNGRTIKRATKASYRLTRKDRHKRISVRVTGSKVGYQSVAVTSGRTRKVK
ncbi:Zn-dependent metalloprotease [Nocardioides terrae]|uniref:Zn-dependent metalloprotease n=1 Tax=Nocardioides terrae TaxID=574651 RepID=A0A1I1M296_9ACTN|nr:M4 family metallopeptidase [Nocardioides terrae]SFC78872.1 Zn-dependent metalloprotease [Nocardioides terrae]